MSSISPNVLINDVKPWDESSWRRFIETNVVPIKALATTIAEQFVGDVAAEVARSLADSASQIIDVAKKVIGEFRDEFEVPSDPIECLRQLVERCGNTFLGVGEAGKYTLLVWTLRKVTREYLLEVLYPTLMDEEKRRKTFQLLGIKEDKPLFKPMVDSPLTDKLTILGYPDYPATCYVEEWGYSLTLSVLPAREPTLGGSICKFVDGLVATLGRPGILSGVKPSADVVKLYLDKCPARPVEVYEHSWVELSWRRSYREFGELCKFKHEYPWSIQGFAIRCVYNLRSPEEWSRVEWETNLLSFLRWLMPSLVTGRTELLWSADGRVALTLERKY